MTVGVEGRSRLSFVPFGGLPVSPCCSRRGFLKQISQLSTLTVHFFCIIEQFWFGWARFLSEETKPADPLWVCTKYASISNNEYWNHELPSAPWSSPAWIEHTPKKGAWTFESLCSTQKVLLVLYKGPYGNYALMFAAVDHLEICFFFPFWDKYYLNIIFFL